MGGSGGSTVAPQTVGGRSCAASARSVGRGRSADMVAAMGALDRRLFVVPSRKLVVVRTGQAAVDLGLR